jgi:enoyl-CoA hydratase
MESIGIEIRGDIAIARMQHGKASALDIEFCDILIKALDSLAAGPSKAVVLTGTGNIFSAGVDLIRLQTDGPAYIERFVPLLSRLMLGLFEFPKPLIAAINGHAVAGGCIMACATDYRVMARGNGRIGVPELQVGVAFPTAALELVRFVVPAENHKTIVYEGATFGNDDALRLGLVDALCDPGELLTCALDKAERLAALPAAPFALTKRQLHAPVLERIAAGKDRDAEVAALWRHPDTLDQVRRYVERTFKRT